MSEKIETDAIERCLTIIVHDGMRTLGLMARTEVELLKSRLAAQSALLRSYRAACGEHASTMVLVHRDEIDGVLGEREEAERGS